MTQPTRQTMLTVLLLLAALTAGCQHTTGTPPQPLNRYLYEDTRALVNLVEDAADLVERQGPAAFEQFRVKGSRWLTESTYIFAYAPDGTCIFHPIAPELIGKNLINLKDINGKPIVRWITELADQPDPKANGWLFYLWEEGKQLSPRWKSSYIRKVVMPDGKICLIGSGSYSLKIEQVWIQQNVDRAASLLQASGDVSNLRELSSPASRFTFLDTYVFVMDMSGHTIVDPSYPTEQGRDLSTYRDATGRRIVEDMRNKLEHADSAWVQFLGVKPGEAIPARKLAYVRKVTSNGRTMIVGSEFYVAIPVWMRM